MLVDLWIAQISIFSVLFGFLDFFLCGFSFCFIAFFCICRIIIGKCLNINILNFIYRNPISKFNEIPIKCQNISIQLFWYIFAWKCSNTSNKLVPWLVNNCNQFSAFAILVFEYTCTKLSHSHVHKHITP